MTSYSMSIILPFSFCSAQPAVRSAAFENVASHFPGAQKIFSDYKVRMQKKKKATQLVTTFAPFSHKIKNRCDGITILCAFFSSGSYENPNNIR